MRIGRRGPKVEKVTIAFQEKTRMFVGLIIFGRTIKYFQLPWERLLRGKQTKKLLQFLMEYFVYNAVKVR